MPTSIKAVGTHVPEGVLTNADLEQMVETSDTWIRERTGILERRIAAADEGSTDLAVAAALDALEAGGFRPEDTDLIVLSTSTPDSTFPSCASRVQARLQARGPAFDVQAACSGFLYGLSVADQFVAAGEARQALVIGTETLTKIVNFKDRGTCVVFGDGAGAVVLGPGQNGAGIRSCVLGSDGQGGDLIYVAPGARTPEGPGRPEIRMDGRKVFRFATEILAQATLQALEKAGVALEDVRLIVPHQANARIIEAAGKRLGVAPEVMANNIAQYGNTSTASIPLALKEAVDAGRVAAGDYIVLVGFGAGLTWGACVIQWEGVPSHAARV
ncbi:MAG TPA: beta-ketoacyl-ACP synthase III [Candidatus Limnocylindrales bacterium]|nr:beta-ketoacyl-ACP synthase III [Candidatus Limnocylindrales bacterium]